MASFDQEIRILLRYERRLLAKAALCLFVVAVIGFLHEFLI